MNTQKRMVINGFRADVHTDQWVAVFHRPNVVGGFKIAVRDRDESIKGAERQSLYVQAQAEGFTRVVVERHIYAGYDLRCIMKRRTGSLIQRITANFVDGRWVESRSSSSSFY